MLMQYSGQRISGYTVKKLAQGQGEQAYGSPVSQSYTTTPVSVY